MSLFKKIQNLLMDDVEETEEIEIEEKTESPKLPTIMQDEIEKKVSAESTPEEVKKETSISDSEATRTNMKFNFPIEFNEKDWTSIKPKKPLYNSTNTKRIENNSINSNFRSTIKKEEPKPVQPPKFRCSPIISPVYGILDKNYKKEDVQAKDIENYEIPRESREVDFETVRKKAFGTLTDELKDNILCEECELLKKEREKEDSKFEYDDLLENIVDTTIENAEENYEDFGIIYDHKEETKEIKPNKIEIEVEDERNNISTDDIKITNHIDEEVLAEKIEVKEPIETRTARNENIMNDITEKINEVPQEEANTSKLELTDDLYDLIDSMYEERS